MAYEEEMRLAKKIREEEEIRNRRLNHLRELE